MLLLDLLNFLSCKCSFSDTSTCLAYFCIYLQLSGYHSSLCGFEGNLTVAAVSPSLRPRHLIKRSKFSVEDATRMWSTLPRSLRASVLVPLTLPTSASPLPKSPVSLRTIPQVQGTLFFPPSLPSNWGHSAIHSFVETWEKVEHKMETPYIEFSVLTWTFR